MQLAFLAERQPYRKRKTFTHPQTQHTTHTHRHTDKMGGGGGGGGLRHLELLYTQPWALEQNYTEMFEILKYCSVVTGTKLHWDVCNTEILFCCHWNKITLRCLQYWNIVLLSLEQNYTEMFAILKYCSVVTGTKLHWDVWNTEILFCCHWNKITLRCLKYWNIVLLCYLLSVASIKAHIHAMRLAGVNFKNSFNAIWIRTGPRSLIKSC